MRTRILKLSALATIALGVLFASCKDKEEIADPKDENILPVSFSVEVPSVITQESSMKSDNETLHGGAIYMHMGTFVAVGKGASLIVQDIITAIRLYGIDKPMSLTYASDDDGRSKNLTVVENTEFEGTTWEYQLTITDADSESEEDGGLAMQIFWNTAPVKGIAILDPYNINRNDTGDWASANFRIDYTEENPNSEYEKEMIVSISGLPLPDTTGNEEARWAMQTLKMFVGKKGDVFDLYGNSNHPNANFFTQNTGFNWAFVASADNAKNLGVAEVGLPMSEETSSDRNILIKEYSIKNVFKAEILDAYGVTEEQLSEYPGAEALVEAALTNTNPPAYFDNGGFKQAGQKPDNNYDEIIPRIESLTPYIPNNITNLQVEFKK